VSQPLDVYLQETRAGVLHLDNRRQFVFQYTQSWLDSDQAIPLSIQLPLQIAAFSDDRARSFFANLLPESELRRVIARKLGFSEQNDFALLEAIGGECAGAVSLLPDDVQPDAGSEYRLLTDSELNILVKEMPDRPMLAGEAGIRLSLAGAQNKLPVWFDGQQVGLPIGGAPSSHILKPLIAGIPHTVENEIFCMRLADRLNLPVPTVQMLQKEQPLYLISRYDREADTEGKLRRIHQEDFCQALGVPPDAKYEAEGGPGLEACFNLLREHSIQPAADISALLNWVIFNYIVGNGDAHAKNISLLLTGSGPRLAPFYDLICTAVYPQLAERMAMKVGNENRPAWIIERRWQVFSEEVGINFRLVQKRLIDTSSGVLDAAADVIDDLQAQYGSCEIYGKIIDVIDARCNKIRRILV
jgi:serine/threonine-protein kinase HipA